MTGAATKIRLDIGERVLPNGLTLLAVRNPGVATFAAGVMLDVDVRDEAESEWGLANLVGDSLDEGTTRLGTLELADELDKLGGSLDCNASGASVQCPEESAAKIVKLLAEVVTRPAFPAGEVRRVQREVLQEIENDADEPRTVASLRFRKRLYAEHPYGRPARGTRDSVARFRPADLRRFHRRTFVPQGGYVAAAGPGEVKAMLDLLERAFRGMRGRRPARPALPEPLLPKKRSDEHLPMAREQVHVFLGHPGIRRVHPDYYALSVMDHVLGTGPGFTSRISRRLRDEMGLCYAVDASITRSAREEPGCFMAYIGTSPEHRAKAIDGFLEEMRRMQSTLPSVDELSDVQEYLTGSFVWQFERNGNLARYAIQCKQFNLGFDYLHRYPDLIRGVTREDVQRVAATHLHPDRVVIVSAGASAAAARRAR